VPCGEKVNMIVSDALGPLLLLVSSVGCGVHVEPYPYGYGPSLKHRYEEPQDPLGAGG
jgi:hypothetical protein